MSAAENYKNQQTFRMPTCPGLLSKYCENTMASIGIAYGQMTDAMFVGREEKKKTLEFQEDSNPNIKITDFAQLNY